MRQTVFMQQKSLAALWGCRGVRAQFSEAVVVGTAGSNSCPAGSTALASIVSCQAAAHRALDEDLISGDSYYDTEEDSEWPAGCYHCDNVGGCLDGAWFNRHATGSAVPGTQLICGSGFEPLPQGRVVFIGDSDVDYWPDTSITVLGSFNVGYAGDTCNDVYGKLDGFLSSLAPATVVLVCGENDLAGGTSVSNTFGRFTDVVNKLYDNGVGRVIYMGTKKEPGTSSLHNKYDQYDDSIRDMAETRAAAAPAGSPPLTMVDVDTSFTALGNPNSFYQDDDLHLSSTGYGHWQTWVASAIDDPSCTVWQSNQCVNTHRNAVGTSAAAGSLSMPAIAVVVLAAFLFA